MLSIPDLAWLLVAYGRGAELLTVLDRRNDRPTPWLEGARAAAGGDFARAADVFGGIGARPYEARARLHAARAFGEAGRGAEAERELRSALAFYRSVGATRRVREAEALLPASA